MQTLGIPILVYEGGEALRFDEVAIRAGLRGILSVMRSIGMLPMLPHHRIGMRTIVARNSMWVRSPMGGIFRVAVPLGGRVSKNALLGTVGDSLGENNVEVRAPFAGLIVGRTNIPLVNEGDPLYHLASYKVPRSISEILKKYRTELDPDFFAGNAPVAPSSQVEIPFSK